MTIPPSALTTSKTIVNINDYFSAGNTGNYKYVIYDPTSLNWYGGNATPLLVTSTTTGTIPKYTIFKNPYKIIPAPSIVISSIISGTTNVYSSSTSGTIILQLGAELTLNYVITNINWNTQFQLNLGSKTITTFQHSSTSSTSGSITFTVFGDLTILNHTLVLTTYGTWNSTPIPVSLNNLGAIQKTLSLPNIIPASSISFPNIKNPAINVNAPNNDLIISSLSVSYQRMSENDYFTQLTKFGSPLVAKNISLTFAAMNFILPFSYIFHSATKVEGFSQPKRESFTNTHELYLESKKSKKLNKSNLQKTSINSNQIESFTEHLTSESNNITIDTLIFDFSLSTLETLNNIELMFSGYTSVTITNLQLVFGTLSLNNKKFNINFIQDSLNATKYTITSITFIGSLTTSLYLINSLTNSSTINYSVNRIVNNNYALIMPLVYSNGGYSLPENYQSQLSNILNPPIPVNPIVNPVVPKPSVITQAPPPSDFLTGLSNATGLSSMILIIVAVIIVLIILYLIYSISITETYKPKIESKSESESEPEPERKSKFESESED